MRVGSSCVGAVAASLLLLSCGNADVEVVSGDPLAEASLEVRGKAGCGVDPSPAIVDQDYALTVSGMRRDLDLVVRLTDATGTRELAARSDASGRATLTARSSAVGAAAASVVGPDRKGNLVELAACGWEVVRQPAAPSCGDRACNGTETCSSCAADCGACPPTSSCEPASSALPNGRHNAGKDCLGCHNGGQAIAFTVGGTLFDSPAGANAVAGATIVLLEANGRTTKLITASNGNFYTTAPLSFPLKVSASKCPSTTPMVDPVSGGGCNGCHGSGNRVHLP